MTLITTGLTNGGVTPHFNFSYDDSFARSATNPGGPEPARTNAVIAECENDYNFLSGCFGGDISITGINVQVATQDANPCNYGPTGFGACWHGNQTSSVIQLIGSGKSYSNNPVYLRYLIISEASEIFMMTQNTGWFQFKDDGSPKDEGSKGEGLSLFLADQFLVLNGFLGTGIESDFAVARYWLNSARLNYIDTAPDDFRTREVKGCTTLFIYYLFAQRGFSINAIIAAAAPKLAGVYENLTGHADGWNSFKKIVDDHYPQVISGDEVFEYHPLGDNVFPVSELSGFNGTRVVSGYSGTMEIFIDRPAMAEVNIRLASENPGLVSVVSPIATIKPGNTSTSISITTTPLFLPRMVVNVRAQYAGKTLTAAVVVVPPRVVSVTLSPDTVAGGDSTLVTVTLDQASLLGDVVVEVLGHPFFAPFPKELGGDEEGKGFLTINQGDLSATVVITTPDLYCESGIAEIMAVYMRGTDSESSASAQLKVKPRVPQGALASLTLFPSTVTGGLPSHGRVTLTEAAPTDTLVELAAVEPGIGLLPLPGHESPVASIDPPSITIPAGSTTAVFTIRTGKIPPGTGPRRTATILAGTCNTKFATLTVTS